MFSGNVTEVSSGSHK